MHKDELWNLSVTKRIFIKSYVHTANNNDNNKNYNNQAFELILMIYLIFSLQNLKS